MEHLRVDPGQGKALVQEVKEDQIRYAEVDLRTGEKSDLGTDRAEAERRFAQGG